MKTSILIIFAAGIGLMFGPYAFPQTTPCPPGVSPSGKTTQSKGTSTKPVSNNAQTAKTQTRTSQSQFHQANKEHGHGYSHGGVGVGVGIGANVDLSGVGQRRAEPDPFAVPAERQPVTARTEEKPPPKKPREVRKTDPFANVQLTGEKAKEQN